MSEFAISETRASNLMSMSRSQLNYESQKREDPQLVKEILLIKEKHPYFGSPRVLEYLKRKGFSVNIKRVRRLLKNLNLLVPKKTKRKKLYLVNPPSTPINGVVDEVWSMDFIFDRLTDGTSFRCFTIIDNYSREVPGIYASKSMAGFSPVGFLEKLKGERKLPRHFILDNGSEFTSSVFVDWCRGNNISLHFIDPGKPVQNAYIESFNGKFRQEFLKQNHFKRIEEVRSKLEKWILYYNTERPHSSLDYLTPKEFADQERAVIDPRINSPVLKTG